MKFNPKLILVIFFVLLGVVFNLLIVIKAHRLVSSKSKITNQEVQSQIDFGQLKQAVEGLKQRKLLVSYQKEAELPAVKTEFQVEILNGSGLAGAASSLEEDLNSIQELKVISIGNTERINSSLLKSKKSVPEALKQKVLVVVREKFSVISEETLADDASLDMVIILG